jgi:branched-chain amino acid transport system substrate-binding protein
LRKFEIFDQGKMRKYALLIGVSEYSEWLKPLPSVVSELKDLEKVLSNPDIGNFSEVEKLSNPDFSSMSISIENFFSKKNRDDLLLLYFSGHGITDENGNLYLAARGTLKNQDGELIKATTVESRTIQRCMNESSSKQQVLVLDCCFSGAFAQGLSAKNAGKINIHQLGGEGRAVLTSSTSIEYSYEGVYTHFIIEGLETGVADQDQDGVISVDELHEYAKGKVKESGQPMTPQIYAIKEGYKIALAKAPVNDPKLLYRREVEYWISVGEGGEILPMGLDALEEKRKEFDLTPKEAESIKEVALAHIREKEKKLGIYKRHFSEAIQLNFPINDQSRKNFKKLQDGLKLSDQDVALIEKPIIEERSKKIQIRPKAEKSLKYILLAIGSIIMFIAGSFASKISPDNTPSPSQSSHCKTDASAEKDLVHSEGERILLKGDTNYRKEEGVRLFINREYEDAINAFTIYREKCVEDPEALIYLNNAKANQSGQSLKIAVSVPIGSNLNVAKEILRGVAQVQDEVNQNSGINGKLLKVLIANDNNDPSRVSEVANQFVNDPEVLAVVGHNASSVSNAASTVYLEKALVAVSPTSYAQNPSGTGKYTYRVNLSIDKIAIKLANYVTNESKKENILICNDTLKSDINGTFYNRFSEIAGKKRINQTKCDFSENKDSAQIISEAVKTGADSIVLHPYIDKISKALEIARDAAKVEEVRQPTLFSVPTLYTEETLEKGQSDVDGMIITTPWHPKLSNNSFPEQANNLWKAPVNWRTAMAYDSTKILTEALKSNPTRKGVQEFLQKKEFSYEGVTGKIEFLESGDRKSSNIGFAKVQPNENTKTGYEFLLLRQ